jgi:triphosphoribosyl-dephospho-CoA synthase
MDDERFTANSHDWVALACLWEATARKAGNVHPGRSFAELNYNDFVVSAIAIAPLFQCCDALSVGQLVRLSVFLTRRAVRTNTNLGIVLLLAPMALSRAERLRDGVVAVLDNLTVEDSREVYQAIRIAEAGGLGEVPDQDVRGIPTLNLREVMALAQDRDLIARQYVNGYHEVFDEGVPALLRGLQSWGNLEDAIVGTHLELIANHPDSLIARKCGIATAQEASRRARVVLDAGWPLADASQLAFAELDAWLRADGNRRNPGTSADLVTACIFAALAENEIKRPLSIPWSRS